MPLLGAFMDDTDADDEEEAHQRKEAQQYIGDEHLDLAFAPVGVKPEVDGRAVGTKIGDKHVVDGHLLEIHL